MKERIVIAEGLLKLKNTPVDKAAVRLREKLEIFKKEGLVTRYSDLQKSEHGVSGMAYVPKDKWGLNNLDPILEFPRVR